MSIDIRADGPHAEDAALVRVLDGEGEAEERESILAHTLTCAPCAARLASIRHRALQFSSLLAEWNDEAMDVPEPALAPSDLERARGRRRSPRPESLPSWMRAAAGIALLLGIGMTVSPLRAWVMEQWTEITTAQSDREQALQPGPARVAAPGHVVSFLPEADEFLLQVDVPQVDGELELLIEAVPRASAEIYGGGTEENLLVLPGGLRIRNAAGSRASYRVTLPAELRQVHVRIGDAPTVSYDPRALMLPARRVLDLRVGSAP